MTQPKAAVAQSWLETSDAVLRGLNHEFSNRLSLARLAPQLSALLAAGEPELQKLATDAGRSEDLLNLLRLYRLMVFVTNEPADPVLVADCTTDAVDLFKHHTAFRDLEIRVQADATIPPVLMSPTSLTQSILLLLCAAARQVSVQPGESGAIVLDFAADANAVRISAHGTEAGARTSGGTQPEFAALRYLIRDVEGTVGAMRGGVVMSIATLARLRQLEKQG
jgi:nitrogen-specific signal transduction histidine kinase